MKRRDFYRFGIFHGIKSGFVVLERPPTLYIREIIREFDKKILKIGKINLSVPNP